MPFFSRSATVDSKISTNSATDTIESGTSSGGSSASPSSAPSSPEAEIKSLPFLDGRRTKLPHHMVQDGTNVGLLSILKQNLGKDLSTITFPVTFNEPLSLLQRLAEDMEYTELIEEAIATEDSVERMALIAAFAISTYASTKHRSGRKPFNPMLGETYEDSRTKFIAEKVCHHPPVLACHAEGNGWEFWATSEAKNKFTGKSIEIEPVGWTHLKIGEDHYRWDKPSSFVRHIISGKNKYLEHIGPMTIENSRTGEYVEVVFKEASFWSKKDSNAVTGTIFSADATPQGQVTGTWDHELHFTSTSSPPKARRIWQINPHPANHQEYYGFTRFGLTLNEFVAENMAPTDSRFRPDQRLMENGCLREAEEEKQRLEDAQRERRKRNADRVPRWFRKVNDGKEGDGQEWEYTGGYWQAREQEWDDVGEPLW